MRGRAQLASRAVAYVRRVTRDEGAPPGLRRLALELGVSQVRAQTALRLGLLGGPRVCGCGAELRAGRELCSVCDRARKRAGRPAAARIPVRSASRKWCPGGHVVDVRGFTTEALMSAGEDARCVNCRAGEPIWAEHLVWWRETVSVVRGPTNTRPPRARQLEPEVALPKRDDRARRLDAALRSGDYVSVAQLGRRLGASDEVIRARARALGVELGTRRGRQLAYGLPIGGTL